MFLQLSVHLFIMLGPWTIVAHPFQIAFVSVYHNYLLTCLCLSPSYRSVLVKVGSSWTGNIPKGHTFIVCVLYVFTKLIILQSEELYKKIGKSAFILTRSFMPPCVAAEYLSSNKISPGSLIYKQTWADLSWRGRQNLCSLSFPLVAPKSPWEATSSFFEETDTNREYFYIKNKGIFKFYVFSLFSIGSSSE